MTSRLPAPQLTRATAKRAAAAASASALAVACIAGSAQAGTTGLADGTWWNSATASSHAGVQPTKIFMTGTGADGGACSVTIVNPIVVEGGKGAQVAGSLSLSPGDQLMARLGGAGGSCVAAGSGAGSAGAGVYAGGAGSAAQGSGTYNSMNFSGAGGGGSTVVYRNAETPASEVAIAGGGGGAGGAVPRPSAPPSPIPGGAGGDASQSGTAGSDGSNFYAIAGTGGAPAPSPSPQSSGLPGQNATCTSIDPSYPIYCGGAGGNGGGAGGTDATAAVSGSVDNSAVVAAAGGGGAGGSSSASLTGAQYSAGGSGSGAGEAGSASVLWADIPTGSVNTVAAGEAFTGSAFTADISPAVASTTTWALLAGAPAGLTINAATGQVGGTSTTAGSYTFGVQVTATTAVEGFGAVELVSVKTVTAQVAASQRPEAPRKVKVTGGISAKKYTVSWKTPLDPTGRGPAEAYVLTLNQLISKKLIVRKTLPASTHTFTISRAKLLKNSIRPRGDVTGYLVYRVRVTAVNTVGAGPISSRTFTLKL